MNFEQLYTSELDLQLNSNDSTVRFTSTRRQQAINDGVREFAALTHCYIRIASIPVSSNVTQYSLSTITDFHLISDQGLVEYHRTDSNDRFTQMAGEDFPRRDELWLNRHEPSWRQSTTLVLYPQAHYLARSAGQLLIGLSEPPKVGSSETVILRVPYEARPIPMTSTGEIPFTDASSLTRLDLVNYHQAFPHYAAYKLLPLMGDLQGAQNQLQAFLGYVQRYNGDQTPQGGQHITLATNYFRRNRLSDPSLDRDPRWRWTPHG